MAFHPVMVQDLRPAGRPWQGPCLVTAILALTGGWPVDAQAACASEDQAVAETLELQRQLDREKMVLLAPHRVYCISHALRVPSEGGLVGDGTATLRYVGRAEVDPGPADRPAAQAPRYSSRAVVVDASGDTRPPYVASRSALLKGFSIDATPVRQIYLDAIVARNVERLTISGVRIYGLPMGTGIKVASLGPGSRIEGNHVHDAYSDVDFRQSRPDDLPQLTGIEVDNDLVQGRASRALAIVDNRIERLRIGPTFERVHGPQTDGIQIAHEASEDIHVARNAITGVHEGIDFFGHASRIEHNRITDVGLFGIKLIHGARDNRVSDNAVLRSGLAGIVLAGSRSASASTAGNAFVRNLVADIDPAGSFAANDSACILLTDNGAQEMLVTNNRFDRNTLDPGPRGKWVINAANSRGAGNRFVDNTVVGSGTSGVVVGLSPAEFRPGPDPHPSIGPPAVVTPSAQR